MGRACNKHEDEFVQGFGGKARKKETTREHLAVHGSITLSRVGCYVTYRRVPDWAIDLLTPYTHHSELQVITALSLIYTLHSSPIFITFY
jgi:hypothetical protein